MNTIPLIFNEQQINRTVIGGRAPSEKKMDVSAVLLNSNASRFHAQTLETLSKCGFASVVSIEPNSGSCNIEELSRRIPSVQFVVPLEAVTDGDMINIGIGEGTMVYLQLEAMDVDTIKTELSVAYIDHNTLQTGFENADDHAFIKSVAQRHGVLFSKPGNGICHQLHLENYGKPGKTQIGRAHV